MADPYIGEIRIFAGSYAPYGWLFCQGQIVSVAQYQALYAVIGNIYGGTPNQNFNLPNLQAYAPIGQGTGPGLTPRVLNQPAGATSVTLTQNQLPAHNHMAQGTNAAANNSDPTGRLWAKDASVPVTQLYGQTVDSPPQGMNPNALGQTGNSQAHSNVQPYQGINFIIATEGIFPVRQ